MLSLLRFLQDAEMTSDCKKEMNEKDRTFPVFKNKKRAARRTFEVTADGLP